ncbi:hypothetical protein [Spirosoma sp. 48-14]|uniref:hypothetical protein n=1 Tax=Spirosoma sp. 48-14 TaxID=1895854 RepID=UPI00096775C3|nr:hypothetical protein [Spirosoma sp. 48-14]OJW75682.1 MAG: hypothetical protein BGO59_08945 [Spirosoma sp. 48-14]
MTYKHVDEETGEVSWFIKCLAPGRPKQYRFNGQTGRFNINGTKDVGPSLTLQPIAWRIFEDNLFGRGRFEKWAEVFFVDETGALSVVMFNNNSVNELLNIAEPLYYDDLQLSDVVLTVTSEKHVNETVVPKGTWYLAKFAYVPADPAVVAELAEYANQYPVYRAETLSPNAVTTLNSPTFAVGLSLLQSGSIAELPEPAN